MEIPRLDDLGLPRILHDFAAKPRGFVVVTGPTGSGKSTTLAAMIDEINETREEHIMTIEDPIEFLHRTRSRIVNQREVGATRRLRPRPEERPAPGPRRHPGRRDARHRDDGHRLTAAETGHLVFATLHTQDAPQTIDRIIDVFPPHQQEQIRVQLSTTLMGVCMQQLLPTRDGSGRVVACEILVPTPAVRTRSARATRSDPDCHPDGRQAQMQTMDSALADLVRRGRISMELALERATDADACRRLMERTR